MPNPEDDIPDPEDYAIVPSRPKTELQKFATWFHQDWQLMFQTFYEGANMYFSRLPKERKATLHRELSDFIAEHAGLPPKKIEKAWVRLGAQAWEPDTVILQVLKDFVWMLSTDETA